ncbi:MAG: hypothetical protein AB7S74_13340 [Hyphomicrobium sp.]
MMNSLQPNSGYWSLQPDAWPIGIVLVDEDDPGRLKRSLDTIYGLGGAGDLIRRSLNSPDGRDTTPGA